MLNNPEATEQALKLLRSGSPFQWYVITLFALVMYAYFNEIAKKNWKGIAAGLSLYMVHWFVEIVNGLIQHFSGHALWTVPTGTAFLILIGVGVELSLMFSIAGLIFSKILPEDPKAKIFGVNNRLLIAIFNAAFFFGFRDISGEDARLCVGVPMVGRPDRVYHGLHPLLGGGDVLL